MEKSRVTTANLFGLCSPLLLWYTVLMVLFPTSKRSLIFCLFSGKPGETDAEEVRVRVFVKTVVGV